MAQQQSLLIAFSSDQQIITAVNTGANAQSFAVEWVHSAAQFGTQDAHDRPGEPVRAGQSASLVQYLTRCQPHLLLFDFTVQEDETIPVLRWLGMIKSSAATRRLPVLAVVGSAEQATLAREAGADGTVGREQLDQIGDTISQLARQENSAEMQTACEQPLSELARHGIALFNAGQFYEAHHGLEDAWNDDTTVAKDLYRAILQVAVAYLQIERGNYRGAVKMFLRVRQWLDPLPDTCRGVDIAQLRADATAAHDQVIALGAAQIADFDRALLKPIQLA